MKYKSFTTAAVMTTFTTKDSDFISTAVWAIWNFVANSLDSVATNPLKMPWHAKQWFVALIWY